MKAEDKVLSEGGAKALMVISGIMLLILLWWNPVAASCGGFATAMLVLLPRVTGLTNKSQQGIGLVVGLPVIVGLCSNLFVFGIAFFVTWCLLVGFSLGLTKPGRK